MCSAWRSSLWRWDAAAREGPCEGHKGLADETGERWTTVGVSPNIIDASFQALMDSVVYKLVKSNAPV